MWTLPHAPTGHDLAAFAALCKYPCLAWFVSPDLIIRAIAGQLVPLVPDPTGVHVAELNSDGKHVRLRNILRALVGETVRYELDAYGHTWQSTVGPVLAPDGILGAVGCSILAPAEPTERGSSLGQPFAFTCDTPDGHEGELVTVKPGPDGGIWRHGRLAPDAFDHYLATGALIPISDDEQPVQRSPRPAAPAGPARLVDLRGWRRRHRA